jgi:1,4-dihydroxy-2-naphthoate octaprenyltransferase
MRSIAVPARRVVAFVRLGRPLFLGGGFALYGLGAAAAAWKTGQPTVWARFVWGQLAITATQLMTHYCNDYFDLEADRANLTPTRWSGGSRVLPAGQLPPSAALIAAVVLGLLALAASVRLAAAPGVAPLTLPLLAAMVVLAWEYSAPPLRLHSTGLGEIDVALVVSCLTPVAGYYLQAGSLAALPFLAAVPVSCLQLAMLLAIEFPDAAGDAATGKRTLVVRWGAARAARAYQAVLVAAYAGLPVLVRAGLPRAVAIGALVPAPLAVTLLFKAARGDWRRREAWEGMAFGSVALLVATALAELGAFVVARGH